jgi:hypothetical protein
MKTLIWILTIFIPAILFAQQKVNVRNFGAVGNGFQDDRISFEKAIANLNDGDTLFIPGGRYALGKSSSEGIRIRDRKNITILGEGMKTQILFYYSSYTSGATKRNSGAIYIQNSKNISVENLNILGMADIPAVSFSYSSETTGIFVDASDTVKIENVGVSQMSGHGIFVSSTITGIVSRNITISSSRLNQNRVSGVLAGNVDGITVTESELNGNGQIGDAGTGYGFAGWSKSRIGYPLNVLLSNNQSNRNVRKGLDFHAGVNISVLNNSVSENGLYGINVEGPGVGGLITIQGNHIQKMGASVARSFQLYNDNHPVVKAEYTSQICAICIFYMRKASDSLPDKTFIIKENTIENLSLHKQIDDPENYSVFPFALANFDGPNRDHNISFHYSGNRVLNSDMTAIFLQGWMGDGSEGRYDFKFNDNYLEMASTIGFSQIYFFDGRTVEFHNNTFHFKDKYTTELTAVNGNTNEDRIANVRYTSVLSGISPIDFRRIRKMSSQPNSLFAYYPGWKIPKISITGNLITMESKFLF